MQTLLDGLRAALVSGLATISLLLLGGLSKADEFFPRFSVENLVLRDSHSTVTIGPDGHLYATTTNSGGREMRDNGAGKMTLASRPAGYQPGVTDGLVAGMEYTSSSNNQSAKSGTALAFELVPPAHAAIVFSGYLEVEQPGVYQFSASDAAPATFSIGGSQVFSSASSNTGLIPLEPGKHAFTFEVDERGESASCSLLMRSPDAVSLAPIPKSALYRHAQAYGLNARGAAEPYLKMPRNERD